jgi:hypothetical protein
VVVVANFAEKPKRGYAIGLPFAGDWLELLNSDVYDNFQIRCRSAMAGISAPGTNRWTVLRRELQSHCRQWRDRACAFGCAIADNAILTAP